MEELEVGELCRTEVLSYDSQGVDDFRRGFQLPLQKKRKFSPIIWGLENKDVKISSKNRILRVSKILHPPPSSDLSIQSLDDVSSEGIPGYLVNNEKVETAVFTKKSTLSHDECQIANPEEVSLRVHNIFTSRWASDIESSRDSDDEDTFGNRLKISHSNSSQENSSKESGDYCSECSDGNKFSGCNERSCSSGSGGIDKDVMDVDDSSTGISGLNEEEMDDDANLFAEGSAVSSNRSVDMLQACRSVFEYEKLNKINEGTYGIVYRSRDKKTGDIVALKKLKMILGKDDLEYGFPLSSLREINILLSFHHPSIVNVKEVVMDDFDDVFMVMEYMEHDLKGLMQVMKQPFSISEIKCLMRQLLEGLEYLHDNWVLHRDLKTSNILFNNKGELKICDFGMSRQFGSPLKPYTQKVVTQWYRAPELLLGAKQYSTSVDMWSVGCIMGEMLSKEPLFQGTTEIDQLNKIFRTLGTPTETIWPGMSLLPAVKANFAKQPHNMLRKKFPLTSFIGSPVLSDLGMDLLNSLLTYDPEKRISAHAAYHHGWFQEVPLPKSKDFMPTFPPLHAQNRYQLWS